MRRTTPTSRDSLPELDVVLTIDPRPSPGLALWWWGVHALAAAGLIASALPRSVAALALGALLVHARLRRPRPPEPIELRAGGRWAVSGARLGGLTLAEGTAVGPFWVRLELAGAGTRVARLLLRDQLDADTWRALQAELRRGRRSDAH
jgi:hypothetical protein